MHSGGRLQGLTGREKGAPHLPGGWFGVRLAGDRGPATTVWRVRRAEARFRLAFVIGVRSPETGFRFAAIYLHQRKVDWLLAAVGGCTRPPLTWRRWGLFQLCPRSVDSSSASPRRSRRFGPGAVIRVFPLTAPRGRGQFSNGCLDLLCWRAMNDSVIRPALALLLSWQCPRHATGWRPSGRCGAGCRPCRCRT